MENIKKTIIWEGRYQPFHKGHLLYTETLLKYNLPLLIYVVNNEISTCYPNFVSPVPDFTTRVDQEHSLEKNPYPFWLRYKIVQMNIVKRFPCHDIIVWGGQRLDIGWHYLKNMLPQERIFLTPTRDYYEDIKAKAWHDLGEKCIRIDTSHIPSISGTKIREKIEKKKDIENYLSPITISLLKQYKFI